MVIITVSVTVSARMTIGALEKSGVVKSWRLVLEGVLLFLLPSIPCLDKFTDTNNDRGAEYEQEEEEFS